MFTPTVVIGAIQGAAAPPVYDADSVVLFARMTNDPGPSRKALIDAAIVALKAASLWTKLDRLGMFAAHDAQAASLDWRAAAKTFTVAGSTTFTADRGWQGDGVSGQIDFGEPLVGGANLATQNDIHAGAWCNVDNGVGGTQPHLGDTNSPSPRFVINAARGASIDSLRANESSTSNVGAAQTTRLGHRTGVRLLSTEKKLYRNGALVDTVAAASVGVSTANALGLRQGSSTYSGDRLAAMHSGLGLDATEIANLHNIMNTYLTAVGGA